MQALRALATSAIVLYAVLPVWAQTPQPFRWETNLDKALQQAQASDRLVLAHFWAEWCGPCRTMENTVFSQSGFGQSLASQFVAVKIDYDQNQAVAKRLGVTRFPTDLILDSKGQVLFKQEGAKNANDYQAAMLAAAAKFRNPAVASKPSIPPAGVISSQTPGSKSSLVPSLPSSGSQATPAYPPPQTQPPRNTTSSAATPQDDRYSYYYSNRGTDRSPAATAVSTASQIPAPAAAPPTVAAASAPTSSTTLAANAPQPTATAVVTTPSPVETASESAAPVVAPSAVTAPTIMSYEPRVAAQASAQPVSTPVTASAPVSSMNQVVAKAVSPAQYNPTNAVASNSATSSTAATQPNSIYGTPKSTEPITQDKLPPGSPPLAMEGFCPVTLCEKRVWTQGDVLWGAVHRGRTYLFASAADQQKFLQNPDRYSPVLSGLDPVLSLDMGQSINGRREHGVFFGDRIYLFSNEQTLAEFEKNPNRYVAEIIQAMR